MFLVTSGTHNLEYGSLILLQHCHCIYLSEYCKGKIKHYYNSYLLFLVLFYFFDYSLKHILLDLRLIHCYKKIFFNKSKHYFILFFFIKYSCMLIYH